MVEREHLVVVKAPLGVPRADPGRTSRIVLSATFVGSPIGPQMRIFTGTVAIAAPICTWHDSRLTYDGRCACPLLLHTENGAGIIFMV